MQDGDLSRLELMFGKEAISKLGQAHFAIIGLGGVGGYAAEAIARFGIGKVTLADADIVDRSNLNRQLCALNSTIGEAKVDVFHNRIKDINPDCQIRSFNKFVENEKDFAEIFNEEIDFVIEAIDTVSAKISLLNYLVNNDIPVVSCMGAGLRNDPSHIKTSSLFKTQGCPLAAKVRKALRGNKAAKDIQCIFSTEKPAEIKIVGEKNEIGKYPLGSTAVIPAIFGLYAANEAVKTYLF